MKFPGRHRNKTKYKCTAHLLVLVGVADCVFSLSQGAQIIAYYLTGDTFSSSSCSVVAPFGLFLVLVVQLLYTLLIVERVNAVTRPIDHYLHCRGKGAPRWEVGLVLATSGGLASLVAASSGTEFSVYRGRCWVDGEGSPVWVVILLTVIPLIPLIFTVSLVGKLLCLPARPGISTISAMTLVYLLSCYSELSISVLRLLHRTQTRRYFLALDSIVMLLSRCLSPLVYSYSLKELTFQFLNYVDEVVLGTPGRVVGRVKGLWRRNKGKWKRGRQAGMRLMEPGEVVQLGGLHGPENSF